MRVLCLRLCLSLCCASFSLWAWGRDVGANLPAFANLVAQQAPTVVNITATSTRAAEGLQFGESPIPDWLKRFAPRREQPQAEEGEATGSGVIISADGYILTNAHVVDGASEILVRLADRRELLARVIGRDKRSDVALLKVEAQGLQVARLGNVATLRVGDWVLAIGSPFGFERSVTAGIVSAKGRALPDETLVPFIQTDVAINPGNSGGPLFNLKGEVVGINSQIYSRSGGFMGISFSIPIDVAMQVQAQLRQFGRVQRGYIGVMVQEVSRDVADSFGLGNPRGALVNGLQANGPAALAGVRQGDILLSFNGLAVNDSVELPRLVSAVRPGTKTTMQVFRAGVIKNLEVLLETFPEEQDEKLEPAPKLSVVRGNALGLLTQDLNSQQKRDFKLQGGAAIRQAFGPAARAELRAGDVISAVVLQGRVEEVRSAEQFNRLINGLAASAAVSLRVQRGEVLSFVGMRIPVKAK